MSSVADELSIEPEKSYSDQEAGNIVCPCTGWGHSFIWPYRIVPGPVESKGEGVTGRTTNEQLHGEITAIKVSLELTFLFEGYR
jgi:hypothetical protein